MDYLHRTWANIHLDNIVHNYQELKKTLKPNCMTMAVVKADAYGHGDGYVSRALQAEGADWFAVSNINEAVSLRRQEVTRPILILGYTPPELAKILADFELTQTVYSSEYAKSLSDAAQSRGIRINCHIKVDSGMSRIGFYAQHGHETQAADEIAAVCRLPALDCTGIFTHFACADELAPDSRAYTLQQFETFTKTTQLLKQQGISFAVRHCCNSAAALEYPQMHLDMVRLGVVLYGLDPSPEFRGKADLKPAMSLHTVVTMVKQLESGISISYGRRYTTKQDGKRIASIAVGYADGYRRNLTNRGKVIVRGRYAPITGSVCMDQMMVDVSDIDGVKTGDEVTLVGEREGCRITLDDFAACNGTINYEEACLIGRRVPRVFWQDGKEIAAVDYIVSAWK